uniref:MORN repeat domain containing protein n=1 Tax=Babesia bovis TaxID=5865 RepID=S6BEF8_BABBO|nr:MORN repeat domain containing protein [Babesia bovis]
MCIYKTDTYMIPCKLISFLLYDLTHQIYSSTDDVNNNEKVEESLPQNTASAHPLTEDDFIATGFKDLLCGEWDDKILVSLLGGQPTKLNSLIDVVSTNGLVERGPVVLKDGSVYCGQWKGKKRHGMGKHFAMDGTRYMGSFEDNMYSGMGDIRYVNGDKFKGYFKNGLKNGKGVMWYTNGDMFDGTWANGLRNGFGVERFSDGSVYMGMFKDNKREGEGELKLSNGVVYERTFDNDVTGHERMMWPTGECYIGEFRHGYKHNHGITTYRNGPVASEKGRYNMGRLDGVIERVMRGGQKFLCVYNKGEFIEDVTNNKEAEKQMEMVPEPNEPTKKLVLVDEAA